MRKVQYKNAEFVESAIAMNLQAGGRSLATARKTGAAGWLLAARGFCWVDASARQANAFGFSDPAYMVVKHKVNARHALQALAISIK